MSRKSRPEQLTLYGDVRELFVRTRDALDAHVGKHAADGEGWKLGGGTVLSARWKHRESDDLDVLYHPDTETSHFEAQLQPAMEKVGGEPGPWGELSRITFGEQHVDLMKAVPAPETGHARASVDGHPTTVLSTVQILNGKLRHRGLDPPVRDVYDIAVCGIEDPESLEIAINGLYGAKLDATILGWKMNEAVHAAKAESQIKGVPARLEEVQEKPAQYAVRAVERAVYGEVTITADRGTVTLTTSCAEATRTREYTSASALERAFTNTGMNEFLRVNGANPTRVRERAASAMRTREKATISRIRRAPLPQRQEELPAIVSAAGGAAPRLRGAGGQPGRRRVGSME